MPQVTSHKSQEKNTRTILKFDVGADGFKKMIYVLVLTAVIVLTAGIFFLNMVIKEMGRMP